MAYMKTGLWLLAMAIIFGTFGAHGLQALVTPERLETWDTAVRYHAWMSLFLIAVAGTAFQISDWVYRLVVAGLVVFRARYTCWFCLISRSWAQSPQSVAS